MKRWIKRYHVIDDNVPSKASLTRDSNYEDHARSMGGYGQGYYVTKEQFFSTKFRDRYKSWDLILRKYLTDRNEDILSIASGPGINELKLIEDGYKVSCSDMKVFPSYSEAKDLFGQFEYFALDILNSWPPRQFDKIFCLSLIYLFNLDELEVVFNNVSKGLKKGGYFILESGGAPDNFAATLYHDWFLRVEMNIVHWISKAMGHKHKLIVQDFGYRKKDEEVAAVAKSCGFSLIEKLTCQHTEEFVRSPTLGRMLKKGYFTRLFNYFGGIIPHSRVFCFEKIC